MILDGAPGGVERSTNRRGGRSVVPVRAAGDNVLASHIVSAEAQVG